jgi:hypothetical protein
MKFFSRYSSPGRPIVPACVSSRYQHDLPVSRMIIALFINNLLE